MKMARSFSGVQSTYEIMTAQKPCFEAPPCNLHSVDSQSPRIVSLCQRTDKNDLDLQMVGIE